MSTQRKPNSIIRYFFVRPLPLILCLVILLLTACRNPFGEGKPDAKQPTKVPPGKQTFTIPEVGILDFDTLDPALAHDPSSIQAVQMYTTGLVSLDHNLHVQPQLAQSWHLDPDGVTWTFTLKKNLKFSDGTPITAEDVAYSLDRALQPATKSTVAPLYLRLIKHADQLLAGRIQTLIGDSILTPNAQTIVITTTTPAGYFLSMLTNSCAAVVEKSLVQRYGSNFTDHLSEGGSSGPFKVATYVHRSRINFVPNSHYYSAPPQLQKVTLAIYHSQDDAYQDYLNGKIDETNIPINQLDSARKRKDFKQVPQLWINYYTMNYLAKPFDNIHIRQAFALAIDKNAIAKNAWKGTVIPTNHIVPQGMDGYNAQLNGPDGTKSLSGNAAVAQKLLQQGLQEEHWTNVAQMPPIHLTYVTGVDSFNQEMLTLQHDWQSVLHIQVIADPVDYTTLLDRVTAATGNENGIQMWGLAWVGEYPDLQDWLSLQFGRGSTNNNMNYGENSSATAALQQETQKALEQADASQNGPARLQSYQRAEQQIVNDVGWLPLTQETATFLRTNNIVGIIDNGQNSIPPDDWAHIYRVE
jgi:ABC-type oligopeptide transport system, periplasmic component